MTFTVNTPSAVYVLYDQTAANSGCMPAWLKAFTSTGETVTNSAGQIFNVYELIAQSGTLWLGANGPTSGTFAMYSVLLQPLCSNGEQLV